ncbi:hypothetical protein EIN_065250 [Entamoeba invadens IP1]|uniref:Thioredoxin domain-containing protein n=1 Tax=Entamoeba invadens IP1 TaxID=370355 RepID=A0A0A1TXL7_ENTIV|nr:hypothetical protein EIN_065250 [Entamoeba invadens IP1]ELP84270.1 hypothetical protein EIN_065250 [Entamoeba invadens IP1]|eukprot:XP_004183616.1 hypothetical protein EIN_065250 [Entamoeba invadens IP1]
MLKKRKVIFTKTRQTLLLVLINKEMLVYFLIKTTEKHTINRIMEATSLDNFKKLVSQGRSVVFISTSSCPSCRSIRPYFIQKATENEKSSLHFVLVNITDIPEFKDILQVRTVPTFASFLDGKPVKTFSGNYRDELDRFVEKNLRMTLSTPPQ